MRIGTTCRRAGWTNGDSEALERATGSLHRVGILQLARPQVAKQPELPEAAPTSLSRPGTTAQQFPLLDRPTLSRARLKTDDGGRAVLEALQLVERLLRRRRTAPGRSIPGVAIWEEFKDQVEAISLGKLGADGQRNRRQDLELAHVRHHERRSRSAYGSEDADGYAKAAAETFDKLSARFGTNDVSAWREPRRMYPVGAQGAGATPELEFFDRGTWNQSIAMGK